SQVVDPLLAMRYAHSLTPSRCPVEWCCAFLQVCERVGCGGGTQRGADYWATGMGSSNAIRGGSPGG
ncbi:hypothetical protein Bpfe_011464, partial [Biomphalaria pfeifferi]